MAKRRTSASKPSWSFGAETYREGALERLEDARILKDQEHYALSAYSAGVAVEGMLRSLVSLKTREFDERHNLQRLAVRVRDLGLLSDAKDHDHDFVGAVQRVARLWRNSLRFAGGKHYERMLRSIGALPIRSTPKRACSQFYDTRSQAVKRCNSEWRRSRRKN